MAEELSPGCARPTGGPIGEAAPADSAPLLQEEEENHVVLVGRNAPDFTAPGYHQGKFINLKLSDHFGKWILLCFYPGDFTFV